MPSLRPGLFDRPIEERRAVERKYDRLIRLHGKNGLRALAIAEAERCDDGYFGPESISWKVYDNIMVAGMGALSGLFISVLDPVGGYGVGQHSMYYYDTIGRVRRSLEFFAGAVYGDTATADRLGRNLFRKHSHVNGEIPGTGESYRANHVESLKFTYVVGWPHLWRAYKTFGDPDATEAEERQFYAEQKRVGELLGIPAGELPGTPEEVQAWVENAEKNIMAFPRPAQDLVDFLTDPPLTPLWPNLWLGPAVRVVIWAGVPLLTPYVRELCGLQHRKILPRVATGVVKAVARLVTIPAIDHLIVPWFGYETWGYQQNAIRHSRGESAVPFVHDPGLALQRGKGGTLPPTDDAHTKPAADSLVSDEAAEDEVRA